MVKAVGIFDSWFRRRKSMRAMPPWVSRNFSPGSTCCSTRLESPMKMLSRALESKFRSWRVRTINLARTATQRHLPDITPSHVLPRSIPKHWSADVGFELDRLRHKNNPVERSRQTSLVSRAIAREEFWCHTWTKDSAVEGCGLTEVTDVGIDGTAIRQGSSVGGSGQAAACQ